MERGSFWERSLAPRRSERDPVTDAADGGSHMDIDWSTFWLPKEGNAKEECEDAFFSRRALHEDPHVATFAVADGATQSMLSRQWANLLVRRFCRRRSRSSVIDEGFLEQAHQVWERWRSGYLHRRAAEDRPIQWYEDEGLRAGAFATLLGLTLIEDPQMWIVTAVGDSCAFHVRKDQLRAAFPIRDSMDFGNRPPLICSNRSRNEALLKVVQQTTGNLRSGDRFYLATDALACWFLQQCEAGEQPWQELDQLTTGSRPEAFEELLSDLRREGLLRNDDVVLMSIRVVST